jgi:hypothetical protein
MYLLCPTNSSGMPEVKIGLPSVVEAAYLPGLMGWGRCGFHFVTSVETYAKFDRRFQSEKILVPGREYIRYRSRKMGSYREGTKLICTTAATFRNLLTVVAFVL